MQFRGTDRYYLAPELEEIVNMRSGLDPQMLVNPVSGETAAEIPNDGSDINLDNNNCSYALLDAQGNSANSTSGWKSSWDTNSSMPLASDEGTNNGSYWDNEQWQGNVGWGDGHVTREGNQILDQTKVGGQSTQDDDIWVDGSPSDALMRDSDGDAPSAGNNNDDSDN